VKIAQDVLDALAQATTDGNALRLSGRIDPNLYTRWTRCCGPPAGSGGAAPKHTCSLRTPPRC
jgi:hypothetical protein